MHLIEGVGSTMMGEDVVTMVVGGVMVEGITMLDLILEVEVGVGEDLQIAEVMLGTRGFEHMDLSSDSALFHQPLRVAQKLNHQDCVGGIAVSSEQEFKSIL